MFVDAAATFLKRTRLVANSLAVYRLPLRSCSCASAVKTHARRRQKMNLVIEINAIKEQILPLYGNSSQSPTVISALSRAYPHVARARSSDGSGAFASRLFPAACS